MDERRSAVNRSSFAPSKPNITVGSQVFESQLLAGERATPDEALRWAMRLLESSAIKHAAGAKSRQSRLTCRQIRGRFRNQRVWDACCTWG